MVIEHACIELVEMSKCPRLKTSKLAKGEGLGWALWCQWKILRRPFDKLREQLRIGLDRCLTLKFVHFPPHFLDAGSVANLQIQPMGFNEGLQRLIALPRTFEQNGESPERIRQ